MSRPGWRTYFLGIAEAVSARADCTRRKVGVVIVKDHRIVSTGYNGAAAGEPGCLTAQACPRGRLSYDEVQPGSSYDTGPGSCTGIHAEANALLYADRDDCRGASLFLVSIIGGEIVRGPRAAPCAGCARLIKAARVSTVHHH